MESFGDNRVLASITVFVLAIVGFVAESVTACDIDISQQPMETVMQAPPPHVMFVIDNSGSMDWEFMTEEESGLFNPFNGNDWWHSYFYIFDNSDNQYSAHVLDDDGKRAWKSQWSGYNKLFYDPSVTYRPWPGASYGNADMNTPRSNPKNASPVFNLAKKFLALGVEYDDFPNDWSTATQVSCGNFTAEFERARDHDYMKIVLATNGTLTVRTRYTGDCTDTVGRILDASGNPYRTSEYPDRENQSWTGGNTYSDDCPIGADCESTTCHNGSDYNFYIKLANVPAGTYYVDVMEYGNDDVGTYKMSIDFNGTCTVAPPPPPRPTPVTIYNAHYFAWDDNNTNGNVDDGEIYLVNFEDTDDDGILDARKFYKFIAHDDFLDPGELIPIQDSDVPNSIKAYNRDADGNPTGIMSFSEELQNFANWFSYYRRRILTAKAAISTALDELDRVNVGFYTINSGLRQPVLYLNDHKSELLDDLFGIEPGGGTPLRKALKNVGRYFDADDGRTGNLGDAPWVSEEDGGACQQAFAVVMTDGYWNGDNPYVGNVDGNDGVPFADSWSNTLADVARKYYDTDLADNLPNAVPVNECDSNSKQHLVTYGLSFGVKGELNPSYDAYQECMLGVINGDPSAPAAPQWGNPNSCDDCGKKIDDLWHAAVNGRGTFVSARNPLELLDALQRIAANISQRAASGAAVSINSEKLTENTVLYQSSYDSTNWTGTLKAFKLNPVTGEQTDELWDAQTRLNNQDWDTGRLIFTSDGSTGMPFRFANLTNLQKSLLGSDAQEKVEYLRGKDVPGLRQRSGKLGDLVHSAPILVNNTVFVGGNDGMLHAFNALTGEERFAFIPNNVFPDLASLTDPSYDHHFFVDLTPTISADKTRLVGGLGAGGKGYFALDISNADAVSDEDSAAQMFLWEYPSSGSDPDLGYSMSKVSIVKSHAGNKVAIFGNGYGSDNCHAVLYILDLDSGQIVKKIDTGVGGDNGLSTPVVVDVNGDFVADYVYAGDLKGNLWKFDISSSNPEDWDVAYKDNVGNPSPLFKVKHGGTSQPITVRPDVMRHCSKHGYMVIFGTGRFFGLNDPYDTSVQSVYGIWDYGDNSTEYIGEFDSASGTLTPSPALMGKNVTMVNQRVVSTSAEYIETSDNETNWNTEADIDGGLSNPANGNIGWYMNFEEEGERTGRDIIIRNGRAIVISVTPSRDKCTGGGSSIIYEFNACSGSSPNEPVFDKNDDNKLDDQDTAGGIPSGKKFETIIHDPVFVKLPRGSGRGQEEFKYFSTSQGTIVRVREPAEYEGLLYWIEW